MMGMHKGKARFVQFGVPGMPDLVAVVNGRFVGIEVKRPKCKQSPAQKSFQVRLEEAGGLYILATSVEDVALLTLK